jgi:heme/copper-type cytochrome/quinol oxidase subunit 1
VDGHILALNQHGVLYSLSAKTGAVDKRTRIANWVNAYGPVLINHILLLTGNAAHSGYLAAIPLKSAIGR